MNNKDIKLLNDIYEDLENQEQKLALSVLIAKINNQRLAKNEREARRKRIRRAINPSYCK